MQLSADNTAAKKTKEKTKFTKSSFDFSLYRNFRLHSIFVLLSAVISYFTTAYLGTSCDRFLHLDTVCSCLQSIQFAHTTGFIPNLCSPSQSTQKSFSNLSRFALSPSIKMVQDIIPFEVALARLIIFLLRGTAWIIWSHPIFWLLPYFYYIVYVANMHFTWYHVVAALLVGFTRHDPFKFAHTNHPEDVYFTLRDLWQLWWIAAAPILFRISICIPEQIPRLYRRLQDTVGDGLALEAALSDDVIESYKPTMPGSQADEALRAEIEQESRRKVLARINGFTTASRVAPTSPSKWDTWSNDIRQKARLDTKRKKSAERVTIASRYQGSFNKKGKIIPPTCVKVTIYRDATTQTIVETRSSGTQTDRVATDAATQTQPKYVSASVQTQETQAKEVDGRRQALTSTQRVRRQTVRLPLAKRFSGNDWAIRNRFDLVFGEVPKGTVEKPKAIPVPEMPAAPEPVVEDALEKELPVAQPPQAEHLNTGAAEDTASVRSAVSQETAVEGQDSAQPLHFRFESEVSVPVPVPPAVFAPAPAPAPWPPFVAPMPAQVVLPSPSFPLPAQGAEHHFFAHDHVLLPIPKDMDLEMGEAVPEPAPMPTNMEQAPAVPSASWPEMCPEMPSPPVSPAESVRSAMDIVVSGHDERVSAMVEENDAKLATMVNGADSQLAALLDESDSEFEDAEGEDVLLEDVPMPVDAEGPAPMDSDEEFMEQMRATLASNDVGMNDGQQSMVPLDAAIQDDARYGEYLELLAAAAAAAETCHEDFGADAASIPNDVEAGDSVMEDSPPAMPAEEAPGPSVSAIQAYMEADAQLQAEMMAAFGIGPDVEPEYWVPPILSPLQVPAAINFAPLQGAPPQWQGQESDEEATTPVMPEHAHLYQDESRYQEEVEKLKPRSMLSRRAGNPPGDKDRVGEG